MADICAIRRCDFKHLRSMMGDPGCRSVALGATVSPACCRERPEVVSHRCPWGPALGTWAHLCWLCPRSPLQGMRPALLCRWGWGTKAQANRILPYLSQVQQSIWASRWGPWHGVVGMPSMVLSIWGLLAPE